MMQESEIRRGILSQAIECKSDVGLMWDDALHNEIASDLVRDKCVIGEINESGMAVVRGIREKGQIELDGPVKCNADSDMLKNHTDSTKVFVVHGRDAELRDSMFAFLRALSLHPIEWSEAVAITGKGSPFMGEILDGAFASAQAVVVLLTPDDVAYLNPRLVTKSDPPYEREPTPQARPNVLFEAGMAMGAHADRTILVQVGEIRPFSDIGGRHIIRLDNSSQRRQDLAERLKSAGCDVNLAGRDWHTTGNFVPEQKKGVHLNSQGTEKPSDQVPNITKLSEADIQAILESWFKNLDIDDALSVIKFAEVDEKLKLPPGSSKMHLKKTVDGLVLWGATIKVKTEGDNTILFIRSTSRLTDSRVVFGRRR